MFPKGPNEDFYWLGHGMGLKSAAQEMQTFVGNSHFTIVAAASPQYEGRTELKLHVKKCFWKMTLAYAPHARQDKKV